MVLSVALQKLGRIFVDIPLRLSTYVEIFFIFISTSTLEISCKLVKNLYFILKEHSLSFLQGAKLDLLLYISDNMAHFPYSVQAEPLFVIYHIDTILSVTGANVLQSFKEVSSYMHLFKILL